MLYMTSVAISARPLAVQGVRSSMVPAITTAAGKEHIYFLFWIKLQAYYKNSITRTKFTKTPSIRPSQDIPLENEFMGCDTIFKKLWCQEVRSRDGGGTGGGTAAGWSWARSLIFPFSNLVRVKFKINRSPEFEWRCLSGCQITLEILSNYL